MRALNKLLSLGALLSACSGASRTIAPITLEPMATIGAAEGSGTMATWPRVSARHPGGFRVLVPQPGGMAALPLAYADDGGLLGPMGASGDSTGGFREPLFTRIGPGDSLWIFDNAQRVLVFGPDRRWARTVQLPVGPWDAQVGADGQMLIAASASDRPLPEAPSRPTTRILTCARSGTPCCCSGVVSAPIERWGESLREPRNDVRDLQST